MSCQQNSDFFNTQKEIKDEKGRNWQITEKGIIYFVTLKELEEMFGAHYTTEEMANNVEGLIAIKRPFTFDVFDHPITVEYIGEICLRCEEEGYCNRCRESDMSTEENRAYEIADEKGAL